MLDMLQVGLTHWHYVQLADHACWFFRWVAQWSAHLADWIVAGIISFGILYGHSCAFLGTVPFACKRWQICRAVD